MASWADLGSFVRTRYEIMRSADDVLWFNLPTIGERTQLVVVRHVRGDDGLPWAQITSPVARPADVDLAKLLELAGDCVLGGAVTADGVIVFRHSIPLGEGTEQAFERSFQLVVGMADRLEHELTGRDEF